MDVRCFTSEVRWLSAKLSVSVAEVSECIIFEEWILRWYNDIHNNNYAMNIN